MSKTNIGIVIKGDAGKIKIQAQLNKEAYAIFIDADGATRTLIKNLLIDAYKREEWSVLFASKRAGAKKINAFDSVAIFKDVNMNKSRFIEQLLFEAYKSDKYSLFFNSKIEAGKQIPEQGHKDEMLEEDTSSSTLEFQVPDLDSDKDEVTW